MPRSRKGGYEATGKVEDMRPPPSGPGAGMRPTVTDLDLDAIEEGVVAVLNYTPGITFMRERLRETFAEHRALRERVEEHRERGNSNFAVAMKWRTKLKEAERRVATLESERDGYRDAIRRWVEARTYAQRIMAQRRFRSLLDASHDQPTVAEMAGLFEGGPDSVEWLREQRGDQGG